MSKSRKGQSSFFVGSFKVAVLLMCFVTVFVLALTLGVFGDGAGGVAEADWNPTFTNSAISVNDKSYSNSADLNTAIQTALHSADKTATVKIDLSSPDIMQDLYAAAGKSTSDGSTPELYWWESASWDNGIGAQGKVNDEAERDVYVWFNLQLPSYITSFLSNSEYTVTANHTADIYCRRKAYTSGEIMWGYAFESSGSAWTSLAWHTDRSTYFQGDGTGNDTKAHDANTTITLNSTDKYVHLGLQGNWAWGGWSGYQNGGVQAANNVFTFTIKVKDNITDTAAPQATVNGDNSTLQSTLATDNGTYLNPDSGLYEIIKNNAPRDNATIATGNVINMTDAAVRKDSITVGVMKYSKKLTLDVKDRIDSSTSANRANANSYSGVAGGSVSGASTEMSLRDISATTAGQTTDTISGRRIPRETRGR